MEWLDEVDESGNLIGLNRYALQFYMTGDPDTDYGVNDTSSEKPGFRSNKAAYVDYSASGEDNTLFYPHPVVQVRENTGSLTISKEVINGDLEEEFAFELILTDAEGNPITDIPESESYEVLENGVIRFTLTHGQSITVTDIPAGTSITLTEVSHDGYTVRIKEGGQTLTAGDQYTFVFADDRELTVVNNAGAELPATGGSGTKVITYGGIAIMLIALMCGIGRHFTRKEEKHSLTLSE